MMAESGIEDFGLAKRKAAERLGVRGAGALPTNAEIQVCLAECLRIFESDDTQSRLDNLRRVAADVMLELEPFAPRLVGAVLAGMVTITSAVELHVFADAPELVAAELERNGMTVRDCQRRYRLDAATTVQRPGLLFRARRGASRGVRVPGAQRAPCAAEPRGSETDAARRRAARCSRCSRQP